MSNTETTTLEQLHNETGLSLSWLRLQVREGNLKGERIGRVYLLPRDSYNMSFLKKHRAHKRAGQTKSKQVDSLLDDV